MSADNWGTCPKCYANHAKRIDDAKNNLDEQYGKVSREDYKILEIRTAELVSSRVETTMREDYEFYLTEDGDFSADYCASCSVCGFKFAFHHGEDVNIT